MNQEQALKVIEEALNIANTRGVFNLADAQTIITALQVLKENENGESSNRPAKAKG